METYVSTMGYHETRVTRPLLRHGLENGDRAVLLRPTDDANTDRGADALDHVEDMLLEIAPEARIDVETIDQTDLLTATLQCCEVIDDASGTVTVNFGGGPREIFLPLTIAAVVHAPAIETALQYTDVDQSVREWDVPNLCATVPEEWWSTLDVVEREGPDVSIPDLHAATDKSKSTISRHVSGLEREDLVETAMDGKTKRVSPSVTGRLLLQRPRR